MSELAPGWRIIPPNMAGAPAAGNFPAIDAVRGPGAGAKIASGRGSGLAFQSMAIPFGLGDELGAAVGATSDYVGGLVRGRDPDWSGLYRDYLSIGRGEVAKAREETPVLSTLSSVAGGLAVPITGAPGIVGGAKIGAGMGAAYGFGEGEGGVTGRLDNAAVGAAVGGAVGAAVPAVGQLVGRIARGLEYVKGLKGPGAQSRAYDMLRKALEADGMTLDDLAARHGSGKPITIADMGPNVRRLVGAANRTGGDAAKVLDEFLETRTLGQFDRISDDAAAGLGVRGQDFQATGATVAARRADAAGPGYREAYARPAPALSDGAKKLLETPDGRRALATASRFMANNGRPMTDDAGNYTVEALDQIQRAMRDAADRASGARGRELSANIGGLRDRFLQELPDDLKIVMANYRSESALLDAMKAGREFLRGDSDSVAVNVANLTDSELQMFRLGAAKELREKMGARIDSGDVSGMFRNPNMRERLAALFPDEETFAKFMAQTADERTMQETRNAILKGSQTAERISADDALGAGALGDAAMDVVSGGANGTSLMRAIWNAGSQARDRFLQGVNQDVGAYIARAATNPNLRQVSGQIGQQPQVPALMQGSAPARAGAAAGRALAPASAAGATAAQPLPQGWRIVPPPQQETQDLSALPQPVERVTAASVQADRPLAPITLARAFVGKSEGRDAAALSAFFQKTTGTRIDPRETAWCAAFANAVLGASGYQGTGRLNARSFLEIGTPTDRPSMGDIAVFWRGSPDSWQGHVGFFAGYETKNGKRYVRVVGGNQDNAVSEKLYPVDRLLGFRQPPKASDAQNV